MHRRWREFVRLAERLPPVGILYRLPTTSRRNMAARLAALQDFVDVIEPSTLHVPLIANFLGANAFVRGTTHRSALLAVDLAAKKQARKAEAAAAAPEVAPAAAAVGITHHGPKTTLATAPCAPASLSAHPNQTVATASRRQGGRSARACLFGPEEDPPSSRPHRGLPDADPDETHMPSLRAHVPEHKKSREECESPLLASPKHKSSGHPSAGVRDAEESAASATGLSGSGALPENPPLASVIEAEVDAIATETPTAHVIEARVSVITTEMPPSHPAVAHSKHASSDDMSDGPPSRLGLTSAFVEPSSQLSSNHPGDAVDIDWFASMSSPPYRPFVPSPDLPTPAMPPPSSATPGASSDTLPRADRGTAQPIQSALLAIEYADASHEHCDTSLDTALNSQVTSLGMSAEMDAVPQSPTSPDASLQEEVTPLSHVLAVAGGLTSSPSSTRSARENQDGGDAGVKEANVQPMSSSEPTQGAGRRSLPSTSVFTGLDAEEGALCTAIGGGQERPCAGLIQSTTARCAPTASHVLSPSAVGAASDATCLSSGDKAAHQQSPSSPRLPLSNLEAGCFSKYQDGDCSPNSRGRLSTLSRKRTQMRSPCSVDAARSEPEQLGGSQAEGVPRHAAPDGADAALEADGGSAVLSLLEVAGGPRTECDGSVSHVDGRPPLQPTRPARGDGGSDQVRTSSCDAIRMPPEVAHAPATDTPEDEVAFRRALAAPAIHPRASHFMSKPKPQRLFADMETAQQAKGPTQSTAEHAGQHQGDSTTNVHLDAASTEHPAMVCHFIAAALPLRPLPAAEHSLRVQPFPPDQTKPPSATLSDASSCLSPTKSSAAAACWPLRSSSVCLRSPDSCDSPADKAASAARDEADAAEAARRMAEHVAADEAARVAEELYAIEEAMRVATEQATLAEVARTASELALAAGAAAMAAEQAAAAEAARRASAEAAAVCAARVAAAEAARQAAERAHQEQVAATVAARLARQHADEAAAVRAASRQVEAAEAAEIEAETGMANARERAEAHCRAARAAEGEAARAASEAARAAAAAAQAQAQAGAATAEQVGGSSVDLQLCSDPQLSSEDQSALADGMRQQQGSSCTREYASLQQSPQQARRPVTMRDLGLGDSSAPHSAKDDVPATQALLTLGTSSSASDGRDTSRRGQRVSFAEDPIVCMLSPDRHGQDYPTTDSPSGQPPTESLTTAATERAASANSAALEGSVVSQNAPVSSESASLAVESHDLDGLVPSARYASAVGRRRSPAASELQSAFEQRLSAVQTETHRLQTGIAALLALPPIAGTEGHGSYATDVRPGSGLGSPEDDLLETSSSMTTLVRPQMSRRLRAFLSVAFALPLVLYVCGMRSFLTGPHLALSSGNITFIHNHSESHITTTQAGKFFGRNGVPEAAEYRASTFKRLAPAHGSDPGVPVADPVDITSESPRRPAFGKNTLSLRSGRLLVRSANALALHIGHSDVAHLRLHRDAAIGLWQVVGGLARHIGRALDGLGTALDLSRAESD